MKFKRANKIWFFFILKSRNDWFHIAAFALIKLNMTALKKSLCISLSIVGAIVGVGFASGKEIVTFFVRHGYLSLLFCLTTGFLFGLFSFIIFKLYKSKDLNEAKVKISHKNKKRKNAEASIKNASTIQNNNKNTKTDNLFNIVLFVCQISICSAMFAGIDSMFEIWKVDLIFGCVLKIVLLFACYIYLIKVNGGVYSANLVLSVGMLVLVVLVFGIRLIAKTYNFASVGVFNIGLLYMPLLYVGMNIFTVFPLLCETANKLTSNKQQITTSVLIGTFVFVTLGIVCLSLLLFGGNLDGEMLMVEVADSVCGVIGFIYSFVVMLGIVTTLLSTAYGASKLLLSKFKRPWATLVCLCVSFTLSFVGFSKIIDFVYPLIGLLCLLFMIIKIIIAKRMNAI